jgi:hypothetical protein
MLLLKPNKKSSSSQVKNGRPKILSASENNSFELLLKINDPQIISYLNKFTEDERRQKAIEALKVGIIALESASPTLDARIVEEKFKSTQDAINKCIEDFQLKTGNTLKEYFDEKGEMPSKLDAFLGDRGKLRDMFSDYFRKDGGALVSLFNSQIGPGSDFYKSLDPSSRESVIAKLEDAVKKNLDGTLKELSAQFSLDEENSALSRLKKSIRDEIEELKKSNTESFSNIIKELSHAKGRAEEAKLGTRKGLELEDLLYEYISPLCINNNDMVALTGKMTGTIKQCKIGDICIEIDKDFIPAQKRIVIEVKGSMGYTMQKAIDELDKAKKNRDASIGIFAFEKGCEPDGMGDLKINRHDFYITVDRSALENGDSVPYLDSAYDLSRLLILAFEKEKTEVSFDREFFEAKVKEILNIVAKQSDVDTTIKQISSSATTLKKQIESFRETIEKEIMLLLKCFSGVKDNTDDFGEKETEAEES